MKCATPRCCICWIWRASPCGRRTGTSGIRWWWAGGPCACNPEPVADFFDLFTLGEGEEVNLELFELYRRCREEGYSKAAFLRRAAQIEGVYVPSLYAVAYEKDGRVESVTPLEGAPARVRKRLLLDLDRVVLSGQVCGALYRYRPRPRHERDFPGLYPGLPVLPGRLYLPPGAGEIAGGGGCAEPGALRRDRL